MQLYDKNIPAINMGNIYCIILVAEVVVEVQVKWTKT